MPHVQCKAMTSNAVQCTHAQNSTDPGTTTQVIFALPPQGDVDYSMRIYNSDGSEPEMCGNGIRCLARFVAEKDKQGPRQYRVLTGAGGHVQALLYCLVHVLLFLRWSVARRSSAQTMFR